MSAPLTAFAAYADRLISGALLRAGGMGLVIARRERALARATFEWSSVVGTVVRSRSSSPCVPTVG